VEVLTFLDIEFDTIRMELRLPNEKLFAINHIKALLTSGFANLPACPMRLTNLTASSILEYLTEQNLLSIKSLTEFSAG
jgi:hypothetical protein